MAFRPLNPSTGSHKATVAAVATRLTAFFPADDQSVGGKYDIPLRAIIFQAPTTNTADVCVGSSAVTTTDFAFRIIKTSDAITLAHFDDGPVRFSDFYIVGTANDVLMVSGIPF